MNYFVRWTALWTVLWTISTTIVLARLYIRMRHEKIRSRSDTLTAVCLVPSTVMYAVALVAGWLGFSGLSSQRARRHIIEVTYFYILSASLVVPLSKVCVVLLLLEVEIARRWRIVLRVIETLLLLTCLANVTVNFFGCYATPEDAIFWTILSGRHGEGHLVPVAAHQNDQQRCIVRTQWLPINSALTVLCEAVILVCAISLVLRVRTSGAQRVRLLVSFSLGLLTIAATIVNTRTNLDIYLAQTHDVKVGVPSFYRGGLWTAAEAFAGLIVASILPMTASLVRLMGRVLGRGPSREAASRSEPEGECSANKVDVDGSASTILVHEEEAIKDFSGEMTVADSAHRRDPV